MFPLWVTWNETCCKDTRFFQMPLKMNPTAELRFKGFQVVWTLHTDTFHITSLNLTWHVFYKNFTFMELIWLLHSQLSSIPFNSFSYFSIKAFCSSKDMQESLGYCMLTPVSLWAALFTFSRTTFSSWYFFCLLFSHSNYNVTAKSDLSF